MGRETADRLPRGQPRRPYFEPHGLRATAISEVRQGGVPSEQAAVFFGVDPATMAAHHEALDETAIADEVASVRLRTPGRNQGDGAAGVPAPSGKVK